MKHRMTLKGVKVKSATATGALGVLALMNNKLGTASKLARSFGGPRELRRGDSSLDTVLDQVLPTLE